MNKERIIFHIDVNNAYLSWTAVDLLNKGGKLDIRTIPSVIGGDESKRHGIVLAKSPIAKRFKIVTAETLYSARKKCSSLKIYPPDMKLYKECSRKFYQYLKQYTPNIEQVSVDECYLDLTGTNFLYKDYLELAHKMKDDIKRMYGFTVNVGIGENKLCAKMASDFEKPDKVHTLYLKEVESKLWPLPIGDLYMVGKATAATLIKLNIRTIKDLANADDNLLHRYFKNQVTYLKNASHGIDYGEVMTTKTKNKCISVSQTLIKDSDDIEKLKKILYLQVQDISRSLRKQELYAKTIAITYKNSLFQSYSHQTKLYNQTNLFDELYKSVLELLKASFQEEEIRNIGVRVSDLVKTKQKQVSLFDEEKDDTSDKVQKLVDDIQNKYGTMSLITADMKEYLEKKD